MDSEVNRYGICLIDLCKATDMHILNGRLLENTDKMTGNGESLIDYVLSSERNFCDISDMKVFDFNDFSNHAPISINWKICTERSSITNTVHKFHKTFYKWDDCHKNDFIYKLECDINLLYTICEEDSSIDATVEHFSDFITERANSLFQKDVKIHKDNIFCSSNFAEKQKW